MTVQTMQWSAERIDAQLLPAYITVQGSTRKSAPRVRLLPCSVRPQIGVVREINALHLELKVTLFSRFPPGLVMTDSGNLLFDHAVKILQDLSVVRSEWCRQKRPCGAFCG